MTASDDREVREYIAGLPEPRQGQMLHLHETIRDAMSGVDIRLWDYAGPLIAYGTYPYANSKGPAGDWFAIGLANRKAYISLYSMGLRDGRYLVETMRERFPGTKAGRSCLNISKPGAIDDSAVRDLVTETIDQFRDRLYVTKPAAG
jgi:Domain of unknown function (DU1801)